MLDALPEIRALSMDVLRAVNRGTYELSIPAISYRIRPVTEEKPAGTRYHGEIRQPG
jgi:hypothetical protein